MSKIVNLRQARKAKMRAQKKAEADANSVAFGTPKAEQKRLQQEQERAARSLDGHHRDKGADKDEPNA